MTTGSWHERAALGERLAADLTGPDIDETVVGLLLDPVDTAVTLRTAIALLRRDDLIGVRHVLRAAAQGDDSVNERIGAAFLTVRADALGAADGRLSSALEIVSRGADVPEAVAARDIATWLFGR